MVSALAANYLGFSGPDMEIVYLFVAGIAALAIVLLIFHGLGRLREKRVEQRSAWQTFHKIARARGFNKAQIRALEELTRKAHLKRPTQIMGAVMVFDECLERVQEQSAMTEDQLALLEGVRQRLVTTVDVHDSKKDRRNLERVQCSFQVESVLIPHDEIEQELATRDMEDDALLLDKLGELTEGVEVDAGQVVDISAGGVALKVGETTDVRVGDYVGLGGDIERWPVDLNGMWGQVCAIQDLEDQASLLLHLRFMAYPLEKKRIIIQLVYRQQEKEKTKKRPRPASQRSKTPQQKRPAENEPHS